MTHPRYRAVIVLLAGLAGLGILASCGDVQVSVSRDTAVTTSAAEAPATTQAATTAGDADTGAAAEPATTTAAVEETRAEILLLEGALLDGQQFDVAAAAGNDVLLWFWAPW